MSALNVVGLCYSDDSRLRHLGFKMTDVVFGACSRLALLREVDTSDTNNPTGQMAEHSWLTWRVRESRRRTGYFLWARLLKLLIPCVNVSNYIPQFRCWIALFRYHRTILRAWLPNHCDYSYIAPKISGRRQHLKHGET